MIWYNECDESNLRSNWSYMDGRSQKLTHYKGVEDGHPSGNTDNIKYIRFYDSLELIEILLHSPEASARQIDRFHPVPAPLLSCRSAPRSWRCLKKRLRREFICGAARFILLSVNTVPVC